MNNIGFQINVRVTLFPRPPETRPPSPTNITPEKDIEIKELAKETFQNKDFICGSKYNSESAAAITVQSLPSGRTYEQLFLDKKETKQPSLKPIKSIYKRQSNEWNASSIEKVKQAILANFSFEKIAEKLFHNKRTAIAIRNIYYKKIKPVTPGIQYNPVK